MDEFEKELKIGFLEEAEESLNSVEQCFLILENDPNDKPTLEKIFRLAHNLKGSSKAVGFDSMGGFTHEFENLLLKLKNNELPVLASTVNLLLRCSDHVKEMVAFHRKDLTGSYDSSALIAELQAASVGKNVSSAHVENNSAKEEEELAEVEINDSEVVTGADFPIADEPMLSVVASSNSSGNNGNHNNNSSKSKPTAVQVDESIRVNLSKVGKLLDYVGEMVILQSVLREQSQTTQLPLLKKTIHQLAKVGKEIQDMSMSLRMVPVKPTFMKMQRIVRDISQILNKEVVFETKGEETELDKTVLEKINDPLVHLIRNSVDHGIESPDARVANGKSRNGKVTLSASHHAGRLLLEVSDDGGGINTEKLKKKAVEKGVISAQAQLTEKEALNLIFAPGFSTKELVTDVSGRGVGMDVVKTNIEELSGEIEVITELGKGTTFKVYLPLTLAIIEGMVLRCGNERYVIPLNHVHETIKPTNDIVREETGLGDLLLLRGENLSLFRLGAMFGRKSTSTVNNMIAIVVRTGLQPFAILVDDIIGQYQVVIKQLGEDLQHLRGVSGSTILGDGKPALIIEPAELIKKEIKQKQQFDSRRVA